MGIISQPWKTTRKENREDENQGQSNGFVFLIACLVPSSFVLGLPLGWLPAFTSAPRHPGKSGKTSL